MLVLPQTYDLLQKHMPLSTEAAMSVSMCRQLNVTPNYAPEKNAPYIHINSNPFAIHTCLKMHE